MPSPKDGKAGSLVSPATPRAAQDADKADPGEAAKLKAEQQQSGTGKYGSTPLKAFKKGEVGTDDPDKPKVWVEIAMVDEDGKPVTGVRYQITLPDGTTSEGTLDEKGVARVEEIDPARAR